MRDAPTSNTDGFLSRAACASSTQMDGPIWNKESVCPP
jgi:hypothetical protein